MPAAAIKKTCSIYEIHGIRYLEYYKQTKKQNKNLSKITLQNLSLFSSIKITNLIIFNEAIWGGKKIYFHPVLENPTKWSKTLKQFVGRIPRWNGAETNARYHVVSTWNTADKLSVFDHFAILRGWHLKG